MADANASPARKRTRRKNDASALALVGGVPAQERELRAQGKRTMRKLLEAGMEVFEKRGYHAARVDDIVKVARTSHGTFYLYFANKEDLLRAMVLDASSQLAELAESLPDISPDDDGFGLLRHWLDQYIGVYERTGPVLRAWTEAAIDTREFRQLGAENLQRFTQALGSRIRETSAGQVQFEPNVAAVAFISMIERFSYLVFTQGLPFARDQVIDTLSVITHAGLFGGAWPHEPAKATTKPGRS